MKSNYTVYVHTFPNGKKYVGVTNQTTNQRWRSGTGYKENKQPAIFHAIMKYGWDNVIHDIMAENLTSKQASSMEVELIKSLNSHISENGYNIAWGGLKGGNIMSDETKKKLSIIRTGTKMSEEAKQKMSQVRKGRRLSDEAKKKLSEANKGLIRSDETRAKISKSKTGKKHTDETKALISAKRKGTTRSEEAKAKTSESLRRTWAEKRANK